MKTISTLSLDECKELRGGNSEALAEGSDILDVRGGIYGNIHRQVLGGGSGGRQAGSSGGAPDGSGSKIYVPVNARLTLC